MRTKLELDDETEAQLETKVCAFLNRWAQHDLIPQFEKVLAQCRQELLPGLRQRLQAMRDQVKPATAPRSKTDVSSRKRSIIETDLHLALHRWTDREIRQLEDEEWARSAFDLSPFLQQEFREKGVFVSYWRSLRAR